MSAVAGPLRILLSDGSGLTARQAATVLSRAGHRVEALTPDPLALVRFTRHVRKVHRVPPYGDDPLRWLDAALAVLDAPSAAGPVDVLLATQEQAAALALHADEVRGRGIGLAVPSFDALALVQDKVSATRTLAETGFPQPPTIVVRDRGELLACGDLPAYVKTPIGTGTVGTARVSDERELVELGSRLGDEAFEAGGLVVQRAVDGPLAMVQCVFDGGRLVAWHANLRIREGAGGGASAKRSLDLAEVRRHCQRLGAALSWHGALSLDVILPGGRAEDALAIDVNPRLVEPANALAAGTDLVGALVEISLGRHPDAQGVGRAGVATHQLLLAVLGAGAAGRRAVLRELVCAARRAGVYAASTEELTPVSGDWEAAIPVATAAAAGLVAPSLARALSRGAVRNYALTSRGWRALLDAGSSPRIPPAS